MAQTTVVASAYDTSGNGGRKIVKLSNGWMVAVAYDPVGAKTYFYKSADNGQTWSQLCYISGFIGAGAAVASVGTKVYLLGSSQSNNLHFWKFDASTQTNVDITSTVSTISSETTISANVSLVANPAGTELHAAWSSKNSTYPNSFNIRYAKGTIDGSGNVTWGSVTQVSAYNTSGFDYKNPCVVVRNDLPFIVVDKTQSGNNGIRGLKFNGTTWDDTILVYGGASYAQSNPCVVVDGNGVIHAAWQGFDSTDSAYYNIRYSKSSDGGATWSGMTKLSSGNVNNQIAPTLSRDNANNLYLLWSSARGGTSDYDIGYRKFDGTSWAATSYLESGAGDQKSPSVMEKESNSMIGWIYMDGSTVKFDSITLNRTPTISLTSPADNLTLAEGNQLQLEGTAGDTDNGNVVTVKYRINGGTTRAIASGVSDGSSPLSFARTLTYSNKRLWDGITDVAGADLAEGVDHTLTVWAEDDQGGKSAEITRKFRVVWNRPPTISGTDTDLGVISAAPSQTYTVSDPEGQSFTITEYLDGEVLRTFSGVAGQEYTVSIPTDKWLRTSLAQHTLKVRATDSAGQFSERTYTFTRTDDRIVFELDEPFLTDAKANRILVTLDAVIPSGASYIVEACNNAFDASPTWEDITGPVSAGRGYIFANETKTAADWGISIRFTFLRGTATEKIIINGFGGAFD